MAEVPSKARLLGSGTAEGEEGENGVTVSVRTASAKLFNPFVSVKIASLPPPSTKD
jgi:hypothetical protein